MNRWNVCRLTTATAVVVLALGVATFGDALAQPPAGDPFDSLGAPAGTQQPNLPQQPGSRSFQIELIEVAEDQLSFRKFSVTGQATVTPQGIDALPEVKLDRLQVAQPRAAMSGTPYGGPNPYAGGYESGMDYSGGEMSMGGEISMYGMPGMAGGVPPWNGTAAQREEVEKRITWQAQIDWVHAKLQSRSDLKESEVDKWKQLIKPVLRSQYLDQLRRQKLQLSVVEKRLEQMNAQLARRQSAVDSVVEFELRRLELQAGGLSMLPDANLQPLTQPSPNGMDPGYSAGGGYGQGEGGMF